MCGSLGELEIEMGTQGEAHRASVCKQFRVLLNFHKRFYNVWKHGGKYSY